VKILIAITSYGKANDAYLARITQEYQSMPFDARIVIFCNEYKQVPAGTELVMGLPSDNPRSLSFAHKKLFADRATEYDLFIYTEDDILITERNINAFLRLCTILQEDEIPGFLLKEISADGTLNYPQAHVHFHWDPSSVCSRGTETCAFFTNEHAASYILTRIQLQRAIASGGFLVKPYEGRYDMLCSAATDPYTQCGFRKLICISRLDDFSLHHLPNKYIGKFGISGQVLRRQVEALIRIGQNGDLPASLFRPETKLMGMSYSKDYYEPAKKEIARLIPNSARSVLSIGCGWGATEVWLTESGLKVVAVPMDPVISSELEGSEVRLVNGDFGSVLKQLAGQQFDYLLILNILHLIEDPVCLLRSFSSLLSDGGQVIATVPNLSSISVLAKRMRRDPRVQPLKRYETSGVHVTSRGVIRRWFDNSGLEVGQFIDLVPERAEKIRRMTMNVISPLLASEIIVVGNKAKTV
jgi:2-polyprenyl-3-methyl-5-hydroxy-6-metoxy-1,4-benzoquinol methylase